MPRSTSNKDTTMTDQIADIARGLTPFVKDELRGPESKLSLGAWLALGLEGCLEKGRNLQLNETGLALRAHLQNTPDAADDSGIAGDDA
jgi:hypothetical protein